MIITSTLTFSFFPLHLDASIRIKIRLDYFFVIYFLCKYYGKLSAGEVVVC